MEANKFESPPSIRSLIMLETAAAMVRGRKRPSFGRQVEISFRPQGAKDWRARFLASDTPEGIDAVASREADLAIVNPSAVLTLAYRGSSIYRHPVPLRAITVLPQYDIFMFAVRADTGLQYLEDVAEQRYPLEVSLRGAEPNHSVHLVLSDILAAAGCPIPELLSWGGTIHYDKGLASAPNRLGAVAAGERDAVFDEAFPLWAAPAVEQGMVFLSLRESTLAALAALGYRQKTVTSEVLPGLPASFEAIDFSGWPIFCHAEASDELVERFCVALEEQKEVIPWDGPGPLPLDRMCGTYPEAPLDVPLHPTAEAFWRSCGYI